MYSHVTRMYLYAVCYSQVLVRILYVTLMYSYQSYGVLVMIIVKYWDLRYNNNNNNNNNENFINITFLDIYNCKSHFLR